MFRRSHCIGEQLNNCSNRNGRNAVTKENKGRRRCDEVAPGQAEATHLTGLPNAGSGFWPNLVRRLLIDMDTSSLCSSFWLLERPAGSLCAWSSAKAPHPAMMAQRPTASQ